MFSTSAATAVVNSKPSLSSSTIESTTPSSKHNKLKRKKGSKVGKSKAANEFVQNLDISFDQECFEQSSTKKPKTPMSPAKNISDLVNSGVSNKNVSDNKNHDLNTPQVSPSKLSSAVNTTLAPRSSTPNNTFPSHVDDIGNTTIVNILEKICEDDDLMNGFKDSDQQCASQSVAGTPTASDIQCLAAVSPKTIVENIAPVESKSKQLRGSSTTPSPPISNGPCASLAPQENAENVHEVTATVEQNKPELVSQFSRNTISYLNAMPSNTGQINTSDWGMASISLPNNQQSAPTCLHSDIGVQKTLYILQTLKEHKLTAHILKDTMIPKTVHNKVVPKSYCVKLLSTTATKPKNIMSLYNVNMTVSTYDYNVLALVWFNTPEPSQSTFALTARSAIIVIRELIEKFNLGQKGKFDIGKSDDGHLSVSINQDGVKIIVNNGQSIYHIKDIVNIPKFQEELNNIMSVLTYHVNLEKIRHEFFEFAQAEFAHCKCGVSSERARSIILTHYYTIMRNKYNPFIPHDIAVIDYFLSAFVNV